MLRPVNDWKWVIRASLVLGLLVSLAACGARDEPHPALDHVAPEGTPALPMGVTSSKSTTIVPTPPATVLPNVVATPVPSPSLSAPTSTGPPPTMLSDETQTDTVPFKRIKKGYWPVSRRLKPTLFVSGVEEGSSRFGDRLRAATLIDDVKPFLSPDEPGAEWRAIVFLGLRASGGYGISVESVSMQEGQVRLTVVVTSPRNDEAVFDAEAHPYEVVVMAEEDIVSPPGTTWSMVTEDGTVLAETVYPAEVQAGTVPFKRISKGDSTDPPIKKPTLLVSGVNEGMKASVFLGFQATGGYGISVVKVSAEEGHIRLTVVVTSPLPRQSRTQVLTYPYDVVVIAEEDIVSPPGTKWSVVTEDGTVLAETVYPAE